jgi:hypothetical protein
VGCPTASTGHRPHRSCFSGLVELLHKAPLASCLGHFSLPCLLSNRVCAVHPCRQCLPSDCRLHASAGTIRTGAAFVSELLLTELLLIQSCLGCCSLPIPPFQHVVCVHMPPFRQAWQSVLSDSRIPTCLLSNMRCRPSCVPAATITSTADFPLVPAG